MGRAGRRRGGGIFRYAPPLWLKVCEYLEDVLGGELHLARRVVQDAVGRRIQTSEAGRLNALRTESVVGNDLEDVLRFESELQILLTEATEGFGYGGIRLPNVVLTEEVTAQVGKPTGVGHGKLRTLRSGEVIRLTG